jgi:hypothetical protein
VITGPEEGPAAGRGHLRAAHADREHVIDLLKAAFVQGRLTKDELDARAGQALTARTYAELAALTGDIPAGPSAARSPARPHNQPKQPHPLRNAAIGSASCLIAALLALWGGAILNNGNTGGCIVLAVFLTVVVIPGIIGYGIVDAVAARRSRKQPPPRPGQDAQALEGQRRGRAGDDPSPPGRRAGQTRADLPAHRSRLRHGGRGVPAPRGARAAPGAA